MAGMCWLEEGQKAAKGLPFQTDYTKNNFALMGHKRFSFPKREKLTGKKKIEGLFKEGSSFYLKSFQVRFLLSADVDQPHQILISVPKKNFKRAVDRNLIKRRIREAYRLNKGLIHEFKPHYIGFVYISKEILTFPEIQDQLIKVLDRLKKNMTD